MGTTVRGLDSTKKQKKARYLATAALNPTPCFDLPEMGVVFPQKYRIPDGTKYSVRDKCV